MSEPSLEPSPRPHTEIKFVDSGTYGCIYSPYIQCDKLPTKGINRYISKLQLSTGSVVNEQKIGALIQTIPFYYEFFAPIFSTCEDVDIGLINEDQIDKCELVAKRRRNTAATAAATPKYVSSQIKFVGKVMLSEYLASLPVKIRLARVLETQVYVLNSVMKLQALSTPVVHYDLKMENIMVSDATAEPIVLDFGMSFAVRPAVDDDLATLRAKFFNPTTKYAAWCIDTVLLSYIAKHVLQTPKDLAKLADEASLKLLEQLIHTYSEDNRVFKYCTPSEKNEYIGGVYGYIAQFVGKPWQILVRELASNYQYWDMYAVISAYLIHMQRHPPFPYSGDFQVPYNKWFANYLATMKAFVLAPPKRRPGNPEYLDTIVQLGLVSLT